MGVLRQTREIPGQSRRYLSLSLAQEIMGYGRLGTCSLYCEAAEWAPTKFESPAIFPNQLPSEHNEEAQTENGERASHTRPSVFVRFAVREEEIALHAAAFSPLLCGCYSF